MEPGKRILAVDYGTKRIGIAISDPLMIFAIPLVTLKNDETFWTEFDRIINEYDIEKIVLGFPLKESGEKTHSTDSVIKFHSDILLKYSKEVVLWDERYTSAIAFERIVQSVSSKKKRRDKGLVDRGAAAIILEEYMEQNKKKL